MSDFLLKNIYSEAFYEQLSEILEECLPHFEPQKFKEAIFTPAFTALELKQRMKHTADVLHTFLPKEYEKAASYLVKIVKTLQQKNIAEKSIEYMFLPEYIATYGIDFYETSVKTMEEITQFTSCEFAVRPFLMRYTDQMLPQMLLWSAHEHRKVRRLASEGTRLRLPWGLKVPALAKNLETILKILENLKQDSCEVVRRSVANNLNDISREYPEKVLQIAQRWKGEQPETDALIKHALRTLLKKAHPEALALYGLESKALALKTFSLQRNQLRIGEQLSFAFEIQNLSPKEQNTRIEYAIYFIKNNGMHSKKVFKITERTIAPDATIKFERQQSFKQMTTRKHYAGTHWIAILLNGEEKNRLSFELSEE
ncbi:MAG: DNA alkylation repair protein [Cytophagales bacterium]|nr:MAG: DNA alkylation repair protein [Cytophagales bacterium]